MKKIILALLLLLASSVGALAQVSGIPPGLVFIQRQSVSAVSTVDFTTGITSRFDHYVLTFTQATYTGTDLSLRVSTDAGATWKSGTTDYCAAVATMDQAGTAGASGGCANPYLLLTGNAIVGQVAGEISVFQLPSSTLIKLFTWRMIKAVASTNAQVVTGGGSYWGSTAAVNGLRLVSGTGAGTITGVFTLYGVRRQ